MKYLAIMLAWAATDVMLLHVMPHGNELFWWMQLFSASGFIAGRLMFWSEP